MKPSSKVIHLILALALSFAVGCQSDSPTEPASGGPPATPKPPAPVTLYNVTVTANPPSIIASSGTPSTVTVNVRRTDNGQAPSDLTKVTLTTTLGEFGSIGSGLKTLELQLVNGRAQAVLFPGGAVGTATVRADVDRSSGVANVQIGQAGTFFISSVTPSVGTPQGGQQVTILGGGFDGPVRVTFNGAAAQVISVTPTQIRAIAPSATAAGVNVGVGQSVPVNVGVTINYNETGTASDTLPGGFVYALGGGGTVQPTAFSISPTHGTNDGGTRVTIVGDGFQEPIQVMFGQGSTASFEGVEATVLEVTNNRIVALTPKASGFGQINVNSLVDILIKNRDTGFATVASDFFKYGNQVIITAMGPGSGPYTGGTRVTLHGQGFDEPATVCLGSNPCIAQQVLSTSGTEITFLTTGVPVTTCPSNGVINVTGVSVTNIDTGDSGSAQIGFSYIVPLPLVFGVSPNSGAIGTQITISGQNFAPNLQVIFGDANSGSSASIVSRTSSSIVARVPTPANGFTFSTEPCDGNGDGIAGGVRNIPTPISVTVRNLDGTGCVVTLSNAFTITPTNTTCTGDTSTPPPPPTVQCNDTFDNDGDGQIDGADPQCTGPTDNSEAS